MIDIIIPTYNGKHHLERCLQALEANTTLIPREEWRVIIADDNSPQAEMQEYLATLSYPVLKNERGQGFPNNCNHAANACDGEFIVLLNSDTQVGTGWLFTMMANMQDPKVGIVGARLLYPSSRKEQRGLIQHAGVARDSSARPYHIWRNQVAKFAPANQRRRVNAVTFACVVIRRSLWNDLGGLDEAFVMGQFEDVDFCWKARERGWEIVYEPEVWIYHYEHGAGDEVAIKSAGPNAELLKQRWGHLGSDEYLFSPIAQSTIDDPATQDLLASFLHEVRGAAMIYAWQRENHDHRDHCRRLAAMEFAGLPEVEKEWAREWMKKFVILIKGVG